MKNLYKALIKSQNDVPQIEKNTEGYGYKYAKLEDIIKTIKPYLICRVPKGDLYLLKEAKRKFLLATKYKRRLLLLNF